MPARPQKTAEDPAPALKDEDIREPLFAYLEEHCGKCRIFEEKVIGKSRADVMMVLPNALAGLEIKSDADSYARLAAQVRNYDRYFDLNYVVVGTSHALHVEEHVPKAWGIITVELSGGAADFYLLRRPQKKTKRSLKRKMSLLWRPELDSIKEKTLRYKYKDKSKAFLIDKIIEAADEEVLDRLISDELFEREYR